MFSAAAAAGSDVGDTYEKVLAEKGPPKSQLDAGSVRILSYPDATIKLKDNVVVSVRTVAAANAPTGAPPPAGPQSPAAKIAELKRQMKAALDKVNLIVNQPVPTVPRTTATNAAWFANGWFHPGATTPNFGTCDVRKTQETAQYDKFEYVAGPDHPDVAFAARDIEFNSMTKFFYVDRTLPKKRLTEAEMVEINRQYRVIAQCDMQLRLTDPGLTDPR